MRREIHKALLKADNDDDFIIGEQIFIRTITLTYYATKTAVDRQAKYPFRIIVHAASNCPLIKTVSKGIVPLTEEELATKTHHKCAYCFG